MKERGQQKPPQIIAELNANLGSSAMTVESIAEKVGINKTTLYSWIEQDREFLEALEMVKEVQEDDPFKTGAEEDSKVNATIIALLLLETKDRKYKTSDS